jgi:hypothetical protein
LKAGNDKDVRGLVVYHLLQHLFEFQVASHIGLK